MRPKQDAVLGLGQVRALIDHIDDSLLLLIACRRALVQAAARLKRSAGLPLRDDRRESQVHARAQALAVRLGLPPAVAHRIIDLLIVDARCLQGLTADLDQGMARTEARKIMTLGASSSAPLVSLSMLRMSARTHRNFLLRLLPPPARLAIPLRLIPYRLQQELLDAAMQHVLSGPLEGGALGFLQDRRLGIEVSDLGLRWVVTLREDRLRACAHGEAAEATVRGSATDLLLLASRLEDADTLFFQRRLVLTGDTELGLTARNLLDRLLWEAVPLALRIALNRCARLARAARAAYRGEAEAVSFVNSPSCRKSSVG